jgi:tRNA dimethylallyltransferase
MEYSMLTILGTTATGKTRLAAKVASQTDGEVISADSRQVFKGMDLGTGKDLQDYIVDGNNVPYHLIDIAEPGEEYSLFRFRHDFQKIYEDMLSRGKFPILCGGTGMYLESVLGNYRMAKVPENGDLRSIMDSKSTEELISWLASLRKLHSTTDTCDRTRLYRAIEIELYHKEHPERVDALPKIDPIVVGIQMDRIIVRQRITERLKQRLNIGMVDEVKKLIEDGVPVKQLLSYGLEYKYIALYLQGQLRYEEMVSLLNTAIHQFAKRQMTWFRRMERNGYKIHWIDGSLPEEEKVKSVIAMLS